LLFIFIITIHIPGLFTSDWQIALVELLKDTGLMGGAIMIAISSTLLKEEPTKNESK